MTVLKNIFSPKEFTGWHMFGVLVLFFGTIITVNMFLAFSAGSTWTGLVVKNTYVESQKFNERQEVYARQEALGWKHQVSLEGSKFNILLTDSFGAPVKDAIVTANIGRPVQEAEDRTIQMTEASGGYFADVALDRGLWRARIYVIGPLGEEWQRTVRFVVKADGGLVVEEKP